MKPSRQIPLVITVLFGLCFISNFSFGQLSEEQISKSDSINNIINDSPYDTSVAKAYLDLSEILYMVNFDTIVELCEKSIAIAEKNLGSSINPNEKLSYLATISGALNNLGYFYDDRGDIVKALNYYHKSLKIREEINDSLGIAISLNNIGIIYVDQNELEIALKYYNKSLKVKESFGDKKSTATSLNNIGTIYRKLGNSEKALSYLNRSLLIRKEIDDKRGVAISLNNIGTLYYRQSELDTALKYYMESLAIKENIGDKRSIAISLTNIGNIFLDKNEVGLAKKYATEALVLSKELKFPNLIRDAANLMSLVYEKEKKWEEAFTMHKLFVSMKDSVQNEKTKTESIKLKSKYEIEKVLSEKELISKEKDLSILKENRNKIIAVFFIVAFVFSLLLIFLIYRGYRKKTVISILLEKQKNEEIKKNEEKNVLLKEIHHRVKNNLQIISSLLRLQSSEIQDEKVLIMFSETQNRVQSIAMLHEHFYKSENLQKINISVYLTRLIEGLIREYQINTKINLDINILSLQIEGSKLVPLGLIINEIISNSLKYGFNDRSRGDIMVHIKHLQENKYEMIIGDDGVGMAKDFKIEESDSLGTQLIQLFTEQLNGTIERLNLPGTIFKIIFEL